MKKFYFVAMILALAVVFNACQKDEMFPADIDLKKAKAITENPSPMALALEANLLDYPEFCDDVCIDLLSPVYYTIAGQSELQTWGNQNKQISYIAYNTEEKFVILVTASGDFNADATYTVSFEDETTVKYLKGTGNITFEFDLPLDWEACQEVSFSIYQEGGSNPVTLEGDYALIGICEDTCEIRSETAFGGGTPGAGNAWWFYFDGVDQQSLWAGQDEVIGTVELINGELVIDLNSGWNLQDVNEPVKIQGYNSSDLPTSRPPAGQFSTYKGKELTVAVNEFDYYVIHLDVEICE